MHCFQLLTNAKNMLRRLVFLFLSITEAVLICLRHNLYRASHGVRKLQSTHYQTILLVFHGSQHFAALNRLFSEYLQMSSYANIKFSHYTVTNRTWFNVMVTRSPWQTSYISLTLLPPKAIDYRSAKLIPTRGNCHLQQAVSSIFTCTVINAGRTFQLLNC